MAAFAYYRDLQEAYAQAFFGLLNLPDIFFTLHPVNTDKKNTAPFL